MGVTANKQCTWATKYLVLLILLIVILRTCSDLGQLFRLADACFRSATSYGIVGSAARTHHFVFFQVQPL